MGIHHCVQKLSLADFAPLPVVSYVVEDTNFRALDASRVLHPTHDHFVEFATEEDARAALALSRFQLADKKLHFYAVSFVRPLQPPDVRATFRAIGRHIERLKRIDDEMRRVGAVRTFRGVPQLRAGLIDESVYATMIEQIKLLRDAKKSCTAEQHTFLCINKPFDVTAARARIQLLYDEECDILVRLREHQLAGVEFEFAAPGEAGVGP